MYSYLSKIAYNIDLMIDQVKTDFKFFKWYELGKCLQDVARLFQNGFWSHLECPF